MRRLTIIATVALLAACSSDSGSGTDNNGSAWDLDAGGDDASANAATNNGDPGNADPNATPNGSTNANAQPNATTNNTSTNNTNPPTNNSNPDMGNSGTGAEGSDCTLNSECSANLTCCPGFDGMGTCEADCFTGGLCGGNETECGDGFECCDLSGINAPDTCLEQCRGGNNGGGTPCDTNADCTGADEVCCPGLDGSGECSTDCFSGGICADDTECGDGEMCCDFNVGKVCLERCNF